MPEHASRRIDDTAPPDFGGFYRFAAQFVEGKAVLDVGCGYGYGTEYLLRSGASSCVGTDNAERAIAFARRTYVAPHLRYAVADAADLSGFDVGSFDVVVSIEVLEHLASPERHIAGIARVLSAGGVLVLSTPNREMVVGRPDHTLSSPYHTREFFFEELRDLLAAHFDHVTIFENLLIPAFEEGQMRRAAREQRRELGLRWAPTVQTPWRMIDCRQLYSHTHSFVAVCAQPRSGGLERPETGVPISREEPTTPMRSKTS